MNKQTVGTCSICGGSVTLPVFFYSVVRPKPTCERCGAVAKLTGPVIPMERPKIPLDRSDREYAEACEANSRLSGQARRRGRGYVPWE